MKKKKMLAIIMAMVLLIGCITIPASASEDSVSTQDAEIYCPAGYSKCLMYPHGYGIVYSGSSSWTSTVFKGFGWQCQNCGQLLVTEGSPKVSGIIGRYAMASKDSEYRVQYNAVGIAFFGGIDGSSYVNWKNDPFFGQACVFY